MHRSGGLCVVLSFETPMVQLKVVESFPLGGYRCDQPRDEIDGLVEVWWQQALQDKAVSFTYAIMKYQH